MRLFSSSDKHSLQKICSQHLVQINLIVDQQCFEISRSKQTAITAQHSNNSNSSSNDNNKNIIFAD